MRYKPLAWLLLFINLVFFIGVATGSASSSTMYGATNYDLGYGVEAASLVTIDPVTASTTLVGRSIEEENTGLSGLAFNSLGQLYASTFDQGYGASRLLQLDPVTSAVIQDLGTIHAGGDALFISDLAINPLTGALFGIGYSTSDWDSAVLYSIDAANALATAIGATELGYSGGIAFSSSGELFATDIWPSNPGGLDPIYKFLQIDPETGSTMDSEDILLEVPIEYRGRIYTSARLEGLAMHQF